MYGYTFFLLLCTPFVVAAHGSGSIVPAPVPVTMAVYAGVCAVIVTWFIAMRTERTRIPLSFRIHIPTRVLQGALACLAAIFVVSFSAGALPLVWWLGFMTFGVVFCALVRLPIDVPHAQLQKKSLAPAVLFLLFCGEFFIPAFQTNQGLFFVLCGYTLVCVSAWMLWGNAILRHEVCARLVHALGTVAVFRTPHVDTTVTNTDRLLISILVVATSFDGLLHSEYWRSLREMFGISAENTFAAALFFLTAVLVFNILYYIAIALMRDDIKAVREYTIQTLANHFTPAFVPIAIGYCLAHNMTRIPFLFSESYIVYTWGLQLGCIILGHVLSVLVSHTRAQALFAASQVKKSQISMTVYMVLITGVSIMMLQAPL
jgi:hypothetical protein